MIRIANAPCSWGVLEFDLEGETVGFRQFLDEVKETGYAGTELGDWGFMLTKPQELGKELRSREMELVGAGASLFARRVHDASGLRTTFHHHCAGYVETPGEVEKLLSSTPEDILGLTLDTGHYRFGGGYPEAAIRLFWDRIWHVHYKDCSVDTAKRSRTEGWDYLTSVRHGVFCELGTGAVEFMTITDELRKRRYDGWIVVEQDVLPGMGSPKETAQRNRDFLVTLGL